MQYSTEQTAATNLRLPLRIDWKNRLLRIAGVEGGIPCAEWLGKFADRHGIDGGGILCPPLRNALIREFPELQLQLVGNYTSPRRLFFWNDEEQLFDICFSTVKSLCGDAFDLPFVPQILAIRGAAIIYDNDSRPVEIAQTGSAGQFVSQPYGQRTHFCSAKEQHLDSVMILFWRDPHKRAKVFPACVSPNSIWPAGTAHLADGQYTFRIGKHRTWSADHVQTVVSESQRWPDEWIYERDGEHVRYIALEGTSPINVIRSHGDSLDISEEDVVHAEQHIASFDPTFVDQNTIKINIHTCPYHAASSLGCQNVPPQYYQDFISSIQTLEKRAADQYGFTMDTYYTLVDASKLEGRCGAEAPLRG